MRKAAINELRCLHDLVKHMPFVRHEQVFEAFYLNGFSSKQGKNLKFGECKTPFEMREEKLVNKAGEYELQAICSRCFTTKRQREQEYAANAIKP